VFYLQHVEVWCYHWGEERISIIKSWRQEGHLVNGNKKNIIWFSEAILISENNPTLPQCGIEDVFQICVFVTLITMMIISDTVHRINNLMAFC